MSIFSSNNNILSSVPVTQSVPTRNRLQDIYNEVLSQKKGNEWANMLENSLAPLGQIIANATIKNGFQQGAVANSLEQERARSDARRLAKQEQANRESENYIDLAREQLGLDTADDERLYNRGLTKDQIETAKQQYADKLAQIEKENTFKKSNLDEIARHNKAMEEIARANQDLSSSTKDISPEEKIKVEANTKKQIELQNDLNKVVANKDAFEEKAKVIKNLVSKQGNTFEQSLDTALGIFGKGDRIQNAKNVKAQLVQATLDAFGVDDKDRDDAKKIEAIVSQVGIPKGNLTRKEAENVIDNIRRIYETRINQKNNELGRLTNPTSIGIDNEDTGGL